MRLALNRDGRGDAAVEAIVPISQPGLSVYTYKGVRLHLSQIDFEIRGTAGARECLIEKS